MPNVIALTKTSALVFFGIIALGFALTEIYRRVKIREHKNYGLNPFDSGMLNGGKAQPIGRTNNR